jgi:hypothetical protein
LGEQSVRGPEKQIVLEFTNNALSAKIAENCAFVFTALRLRRKLAGIAMAILLFIRDQIKGSVIRRKRYLTPAATIKSTLSATVITPP